MSRRSLSLLLVGTAVGLIFAATLVVAAIIGTPDHKPDRTPTTLVVECPDGKPIVVAGDRNADGAVVAIVDPACLAP